MAKRTWIKVDSQHFSIVTDQSAKTAQKVVADLEAFRHFRQQFGTMKMLELTKPLPILALGDDAFSELGFPSLWAGVFALNLNGYSAIANIEGYLEGGKTDSWPRKVLLHEYFHFLSRLSERTLAYPLWVDEGMAEYWATFNADGATFRVGDRVSGRGGREVGLYNEAGRLSINLEKIFNTTSLPLDGKNWVDGFDVGHFYSSAFFAVHYLNSTDTLSAALGKYVNLINQGYRQDRAVELAFEKSYEQLNQDMIKYLTGRPAVQVITLKQSNFAFPQLPTTVTALDKPAVYAQLARILPRHGYLRKDLVKLLATNRALNPRDSDANVLPVIYGTEADAATIASVEQRFPQHPMLLNRRADRLRRYAEHMKDLGDAGWLSVAYQARDDYRNAISIDRDYAAPYNGLGLLYELLPADASLREAVDALDTASIYTRSPDTFRQLANVYVRLGQPMEALGALRSAVAFNQRTMLGTEALLLENVELLHNLADGATASNAGLDYPSGMHYAGALANGKPEGMGKMTLPNGSYYEGQFAQGLPHGKGKLVSDMGLVYQGDFLRGFGRGQGEVSYPAGGNVISYKGQVDYMKPSGKGELVSKIGRLAGNFEDGYLSGAGEFTAANKPLTLTGMWLRGGMQWPAENGIVFRGLANAYGVRHGYGTCSSTDVHDVPVACVYIDGKLVSEPK